MKFKTVAEVLNVFLKYYTYQSKSEMDVQSIINLMSKIITANRSDDALFERDLKCILALDQHSDYSEIPKSQSIRFSYIKKTAELLLRLKNTNNLMLSINQCNTVLKCIDFIISLGFIPCLIPSVWKSFEKKQTNIVQFSNSIPTNTKYEELKFIVNLFYDLIKEPTFKGLIMMNNMNVLLAGLCQLCLLPIAKPGTKIALESSVDELKYEQLINEQKTFKNILKEFILVNRNPLVIREIIFTLGRKNCEKHLKHGLEELFSDLLIQSNGIQTFLRVACDLSSNTSQQFYQHGLQQWSNLIHNYYITSKIKYIKCIIPQIWELVRSSSKFHQTECQSVAVYCMYLMSMENYTDFLKFYIYPIEQSVHACKYKSNENVSQSIEDLHTLFYLFRNEIWSLSPKLLTHVATVIYNIYTSTASSIYYLKSKLEDLVYLILIHFSNSKDHLKQIVFAQYKISIEYNDDNAEIQLKYSERTHQLDLEDQVDLVLNLIDKRTNFELMKTMFITLLDMYTDISLNEYSVMEKLFIVKAIQHLIEKNGVQKSIDPEIVLNLIKSILKRSSEQVNIDIQILSVALMVLRCVLENINEKCNNNLNCLMDYLTNIFEMVEDEIFRELLLEMQQKIKQIQNSSSKQPVEDHCTIDNILFETRDPLLPLRAHALIKLKKKIESGDKMVLVKKSAILIAIQENLKNADSYLYLSAIYTLTALCSFCPNDILPILCEEYSLPKHYNNSPETRLKIGEVLMKTVQLLNETIPLHKNQLLNTFLAGVRDDDNLVRASSLSNLADICRLMRYNLGSIISEIVNCADYVLRFDPAVEPRRAAVLLLQNIIQGADSELLEILEDSIKDIYKMLKFQYNCEKDEIIKLHSQVAIERLNDIMKSLFLSEKNSKLTLHIK